MIIKNILVFFSIALAGNALADQIEFDGYSYFVIGKESLNYQENPISQGVSTDTSINNIAIRTGGLYPINDIMDFSIDTSTTLLPATAFETWSVNSDSSGDALRAFLPYPNRPVQQNDFRLSTSSFQALAHYKHRDQFRSVYGVNFSLDSFKRFNWTTSQGGSVVLTEGAVEEDTSILNAVIGLDYESDGLARHGNRWQMRVLYLKPVWRNTLNTSNPKNTFTSTSGFGISIQGAYNFRIYKGIEVGIFSSYAYRYEDSEIQGNIELPKNTFSNLFTGVQLSWKLGRYETLKVTEPSMQTLTVDQ